MRGKPFCRGNDARRRSHAPWRTVQVGLTTAEAAEQWAALRREIIDTLERADLLARSSLRLHKAVQSDAHRVARELTRELWETYRGTGLACEDLRALVIEATLRIAGHTWDPTKGPLDELVRPVVKQALKGYK